MVWAATPPARPPVPTTKHTWEKKTGAAASPLSKEALLAHFQGRVAKWWIPDDVVFVDAIALGPTGERARVFVVCVWLVRD